MTPLEAELRTLIATEGPIPVARYMALCLGHPRHGYYMGRDPFGAAGDFTTAPEISQMFGELLGLWCAACWQQIGAPDPVRLVELGPGRGTLMADVLRAAGRSIASASRSSGTAGLSASRSRNFMMRQFISATSSSPTCHVMCWLMK